MLVIILISPVGIVVPVFAVENTNVFSVVSSTTKVLLNSLYESSAPVNAILAPGLIPCLSEVMVTFVVTLETESTSKATVFERGKPREISVLLPVRNVLPVKVTIVSVSETVVVDSTVALVNESVRVSPIVRVPLPENPFNKIVEVFA